MSFKKSWNCPQYIDFSCIVRQFFCNFFKNCLKSKLNGNLGESQSTKIATDILNRESKMFECVKDEFHSSIHHQVLMYFENCKTDFL